MIAHGRSVSHAPLLNRRGLVGASCGEGSPLMEELGLQDHEELVRELEEERGARS